MSQGRLPLSLLSSLPKQEGIDRTGLQSCAWLPAFCEASSQVQEPPSWAEAAPPPPLMLTQAGGVGQGWPWDLRSAATFLQSQQLNARPAEPAGQCEGKQLPTICQQQSFSNPPVGGVVQGGLPLLPAPPLACFSCCGKWGWTTNGRKGTCDLCREERWG